MKQIAVLKENGEKAGEVSLPESYFGSEVSESAVYYSVKAQLANQRQGDANTKDRSELAYSTRKPWRQKGTGRARAGSRRSPLWRGGGTVFGPKAKHYDVRVPKKVRRAALQSALSSKAAEEGAVVVIEDLQFDAPGTKRIAELLKNAGAAKVRALIMTAGHKPLVWKSVRNIPLVEIRPFGECSAYDVLLAEKLLIEKSAIEQLESKSHGKSVSDSETAAAD
ncbi:MAG: 50S ribosomal protein L4 [Candidatus Glassbacteria bacterium RIFCSPLOWO2_12_FULL_58_11]|uniref:Large ribosomal subunit protein uL4 n=2 Tax=Candidatus Glassiibacteriota TaxID=1817805 RepID=A0A1F5YPU5_9BACT|nr:ribosomal protein L4 [uncultured bacterium]OGF99749.1 MAG: 50S ribosomal protein L4 [Candidatus Glassbacteria bacterium GWA2_58_10]OGG02007.1 MAG: 50S ribosomal protein L4 [Candidatus Glassbacteria bacterium RIFCSPLOWO2_12_FULL_58_11]